MSPSHCDHVYRLNFRYEVPTTYRQAEVLTTAQLPRSADRYISFDFPHNLLSTTAPAKPSDFWGPGWGRSALRINRRAIKQISNKQQIKLASDKVI
jgi:hypothetical protein